MPPIQIAAPNWCRHSTSSSGARSSSRAAACVVRVAAASSIAVSASSGATGARWPGANSQRDHRGGSDLRPCPAMAKFAPQHVADRQIDGADQHGGLQRDRRRLADHQRDGAPGGDRDAGRARSLAPAEPSREPAGAASSARNSTPPSAIDCASDGQAMDDDRQVAEQIDQQRHASGARHGEGHIAAGDMAVDRQHLPAHDIGAGRIRSALVARTLGGPSARSSAPSGCGPGRSGSGASGRGRSGCCSGTTCATLPAGTLPPAGGWLCQDGVRHGRMTAPATHAEQRHDDDSVRAAGGSNGGPSCSRRACYRLSVAGTQLPDPADLDRRLNAP